MPRERVEARWTHALRDPELPLYQDPQRGQRRCPSDVASEPGFVADCSLYLNRFFFSPRSLMNDPKTTAFETAAAARISSEARSDRNCWSECRSMTLVTRYNVMPTKISEKLKSRTSDSLRLAGMVELKTIGMGNTTRRRSVITSLTPIVISCA